MNTGNFRVALSDPHTQPLLPLLNVPNCRYHVSYVQKPRYLHVMEKLPTVLGNVAVVTTVATIVLTLTATIAGLLALVTQFAIGAGNLLSGVAFATASVATLFTVAVGFIDRSDTNTGSGA